MPLNPNTSQENSQLISLALRNSGGQSMNPYLCSGISQFGHDRLGTILIQYIKTNSLSVQKMLLDTRIRGSKLRRFFIAKSTMETARETVL